MSLVLIFVLFLVPLVRAAGDGFVPIPGGSFSSGGAVLRVEGFEMLDHPVTNDEYKRFVDATAQAAPLHWENGRIPEGMDGLPVVFVNRYDVDAYCRWRTASENRVYRLPLAAEFEYAARAGRSAAIHPWDGSPTPDKANYDSGGTRTFGEWRGRLKPVKSYPPNPWKLYDLAGTVWQMVDRNPDEAIQRFKYRIDTPVSLEGTIAGGSWARAEYYTRLGVYSGASPGIRHPDLGFRVVRETQGSTHFRRLPRRLALGYSGGAVQLSWQLLAGDKPGTGFHVYRCRRRDAAGDRITETPVRDSTTFRDNAPGAGGRLYYRVRAVESGGAEGPPSEWAGVDMEAKAAGSILEFEPTVRKGRAVPVFGDLNGDGILDAVLRSDNGIQEMSRDPGVPVELEAFTSYGRPLWRRAQINHDQCYGSANNAPFVVWDLNGDGSAEIVARLQEGAEVYLAVLDGMTGRTLRRTPWTAMVSDFSKSSTRIHLAIAYLDGRSPAIVTQTGLYENEVIDAYDGELKHLWKYQSFAETNGSGSHHIDIADLDGDGRDEVVIGSTALNPDGKMRWSIYREHPDIVAVKRILPGAAGRQVFYAVETSTHAGAYLVDAATGRILWKVNREDDPRWTHAHSGWTADIYEGSPGMEMLANRDGHETKDFVLFAADGKVLVEGFPAPMWWPVNWTGRASRDLISRNGLKLARFDGKGVVESPDPGPGALSPKGCGGVMSADLAGDYRDEIVCLATAGDGGPVVRVYSNFAPVNRRELTRTESREYRLWLARNWGGGYPSYFEWEP